MTTPNASNVSSDITTILADLTAATAYAAVANYASQETARKNAEKAQWQLSADVVQANIDANPGGGAQSRDLAEATERQTDDLEKAAG